MPRSRPSPMLLSVLLVVGLSGCVQSPGDDGILGTAGDLTDQARFCLSLTRAVNAAESGSRAIARDAVDEAVAQAPDDLLADVRALADRLRDGQDPSVAADDDQLAGAARDVRDLVDDLCEPPT